MGFAAGFAAGAVSTLAVLGVLAYVFRHYLIGYLIQRGQRQMMQGDGLEEMMQELGDAIGGENRR